jgi:hypothetical protein
MFGWLASAAIGCRTSLVAKPSCRLLFAVDGMGRWWDVVANVDQERAGGLCFRGSGALASTNEWVAVPSVGRDRHACRLTKHLRLGASDRNVDLLAQLVGGLVVDIEDIFEPALGGTLGVDPPASRVVADLSASGRDRGQHHVPSDGLPLVGAGGCGCTVALCPVTGILDHRPHALARS